MPQVFVHGPIGAAGSDLVDPVGSVPRYRASRPTVLFVEMRRWRQRSARPLRCRGVKVMGAGDVTGDPDTGASTDEVVELAPAASGVSREEGFAAFMAASQAELLRTAWFLVGDAHRAEELTQQALVRTYGAWPRAQRDPLAYTRRVLVNLRTDSWRRRRREVLTAPERLPDRGRADTGGVEQRDQFSRVLGVLTARQRRVIVLRYLLDLPEAEVAADLGISVGTVKSTASRALARLRAEMPDAARPGEPDRGGVDDQPE